MHVISAKRLREFWAIHPDAEAPLRAWLKAAERAHWTKPQDVTGEYPYVSFVGELAVFNVGGNKYRLVARIHYSNGKVYVLHVLTPADYDRGDWKDG